MGLAAFAIKVPRVSFTSDEPPVGRLEAMPEPLRDLDLAADLEICGNNGGLDFGSRRFHAFVCRAMVLWGGMWAGGIGRGVNWAPPATPSDAPRP